MKKIAFAAVIGFCLGYLGSASAVSTVPAKGAAADYVNPAFMPPKAPQVCGTDGGAACQLTFGTGACLRISAEGTWKYYVGGIPTVADGGPIISLATGSLITGTDGGICYWSGTKATDGGSTYYLPDAGVTSACALPHGVRIFDSQVEGWCFMNNQAALGAISMDGGAFSVSERYP